MCKKSKFKNKKNGRTYVPLIDNVEVLMKDPTTREWVPAVIYSAQHEARSISPPMVFVREKMDFFKKNDLIDEEVYPRREAIIFHGLSGDVKLAALNAMKSPLSVVLYSAIRKARSIQHNLGSKVGVEHVDYSIIHLLRLEDLLSSISPLTPVILTERGSVDAPFFAYREGNISFEEALELGKKLKEEEEWVLRAYNTVNILRKAVRVLDIKYINDLVIDKCRSDIFPGGVDQYVEDQDKYIEYLSIVYNNELDVLDVFDVENFLNQNNLTK